MEKKDYQIGDEIRTWSVCIPDNAGKEVEKTLKSTWINTGKKELHLCIKEFTTRKQIWCMTV